MFAPVPGPPSPPFTSDDGVPATYTLVCDVGTFVLTGQDVGFVYTPAGGGWRPHWQIERERREKRRRREEEEILAVVSEALPALVSAARERYRG